MSRRFLKRHSRLWINVGLMTSVISALACKPRSSDGRLAEAVGPQAPLHNIPLKNFAYDLNNDYARALGDRVDCATLKQIVAYPKQNGLRATVGNLSRSQYIYNDMLASLHDQGTIQSFCRASNSDDNAVSGVKALAQAARNKGGKLHIIISAGYRLQLQSRILSASMAAWQKIGGDVTVSRIECNNPYDTIANCAKELEQKLKNEGTGELLFFWAHGKGANIILEALGHDQALRDRTLGMVTVGAPFGGSAASTLVKNSVRAAGKILAKFDLGIDPVAFENDPLSFIMTPIQDTTGAPSMADRIKAGGADIQRASMEMHPSERFNALAQLKGVNFSSKLGVIPIFHVASVLDIADLDPTPPLSMTANGLVASKQAKTWSNFLQVLAIPAFYSYPLSDGAVALEHAVIPPEYAPNSLKPQMLALFRLDHASMGFDKSYQLGQGLPNVAIVDALLATAAAKL